MPFTNLNLITVTGKYFLLSGNPASGTVTFTPSTVLTDTTANEIIYPSGFTANLNSSTGAFSISLPSTNDPDIVPTGWTYKVTETISGGLTSRTYDIELPYNLAGATVDLADITPAVPTDLMSTYALQADFNTHVASLFDGYQSGVWYAGEEQAASTTLLWPTNMRYIGGSFYCRKQQNFTSVGVEVSTAGAAGALVAIIIARWQTNNLTLTKMAEVTGLDGATVGFKSAAINWTPAPGWYSLGVVCYGAPATMPTIRGTATGNRPWFGSGSGLALNSGAFDLNPIASIPAPTSFTVVRNNWQTPLVRLQAA